MSGSQPAGSPYSPSVVNPTAGDSSIATASVPPVQLAALPDLVSGGNPENRWEYRRSTQIYTRWWAIQYYGIWFDGVRSRPVRWTLDDIERIEVGGMIMYKETWAWAYFDDINYHS